MNLPPLPEPQRPNEDGQTMCAVRWIVETPAGWLGSWDREAFDAYVSAYAEAAALAMRERCAKVCEDDDSDPGSTAVAIRIAAAIRALDATP
jgi:hypothetical protein